VSVGKLLVGGGDGDGERGIFRGEFSEEKFLVVVVVVI
jgi:hypothetical protein